MGLCACENQKKKVIQTQQKQTLKAQISIAPVQPIQMAAKHTNHAYKPQSLQPLVTKYPQPFDLQDNPQNNFFYSINEFQSDQENDGNMYTFFKNGVIPQGDIIEFCMKQRTKENILNIGIGTKATFGDKAPNDTIKHQSKQLWIDNKKCFVDNQMFIVPQILQNTLFKIVIDTKKWSIGWFIEGRLIVTKQIPVKMRNKSFYLTIGLYSNEDEVQFLQQ